MNLKACKQMILCVTLPVSALYYLMTIQYLKMWMYFLFISFWAHWISTIYYTLRYSILHVMHGIALLKYIQSIIALHCVSISPHPLFILMPIFCIWGCQGSESNTSWWLNVQQIRNLKGEVWTVGMQMHSLLIPRTNALQHVPHLPSPLGSSTIFCHWCVLVRLHAAKRLSLLWAKGKLLHMYLIPSKMIYPQGLCIRIHL